MELEILPLIAVQQLAEACACSVEKTRVRGIVPKQGSALPQGNTCGCCTTGRPTGTTLGSIQENTRAGPGKVRRDGVYEAKIAAVAPGLWFSRIANNQKPSPA